MYIGLMFISKKLDLENFVSIFLYVSAIFNQVVWNYIIKLKVKTGPARKKWKKSPRQLLNFFGVNFLNFFSRDWVSLEIRIKILFIVLIMLLLWFRNMCWCKILKFWNNEMSLCWSIYWLWTYFFCNYLFVLFSNTVLKPCINKHTRNGDNFKGTDWWKIKF